MQLPAGSASKESACNQETRAQFLGWENPLEKEMAIHFSILAWEIPLAERPGRATVQGVAKSQT